MMGLPQRLALCGAAWLVWSAAGASPPPSVQVPSLDVVHGTAVVLLGEADDWTPVVPCKQLAASVAPALPAVRWKSFEGAFHGFDGEGPVRLRKDVPNGVTPGAGVHVGGQDAARQASAEHLDLFIKDVWKLNP